MRWDKMLVNKHRLSVLRRGVAMSASLKVGVVRAMSVFAHLRGPFIVNAGISLRFLGSGLRYRTIHRVLSRIFVSCDTLSIFRSLFC